MPGTSTAENCQRWLERCLNLQIISARPRPYDTKILRYPQNSKGDSYTRVWWPSSRLRGNVHFWKAASKDSTRALNSKQISVESGIDQNIHLETVPLLTSHPASNSLPPNQWDVKQNTEKTTTGALEGTTNHRKPELNGDCHYCGKQRQRARECGSKKREQAQQETPQNKRREQTERQKYNSKLVCQNCGYTGHTARTADCRHKRKEASAYRSVPYQKQSTENNQQSWKNFKKDYKTLPINEASEQPDHITSSGNENEQSLN